MGYQIVNAAQDASARRLRAQGEHLGRASTLVMAVLISIAIAAVVWSVSRMTASVGKALDHSHVMACQITRDPATGSTVPRGCGR